MLSVALRVASSPGCVGPGDTGKTRDQQRITRDQQRIVTLPIHGLGVLSTKVSMEHASVLRRLCHGLTFVLLSFDAHTSGWRAPSYI